MIRTHFAKLKRRKQAGAGQAADVQRTEILATEVIEGLTAEDRERADPLGALKEGQEIHGRHRYELRQLLGRGAFGAVWEAACVEIDPDAADIPPETAAIKFFSVSADPDGAAFLRRELAALRSMRSSTIPRIYDWIIADPLSFFVMDHYRHGALADEFESPGTMDDKQAWHVLTELMRALLVAHRAGLLHLDIKPSNIMRDGVGGYKLIDFGISQATQIIDGPGRTVGAGTPGYQAPEQRRLELHKMDTRTDLWAVGATVWALRTGYDLPYHPELLNTEASGNEPSLPPLSSLCADVAPELEEIISNLLRGDQDARPGGAAAVLESIKEITGAPVSGPPAGAEPRPHTNEEVDAVIEDLMDPLWSALCRQPEFRGSFAKFEDGDYLCREGRASHDAFVLLSGKVHTETKGRILDTEDREGTFIGEISTLTGASRAASVCAEGTVWTCMFNAAEFERLLAAHPSIGVRLLKLLAGRVLSYSKVATR